MEIKSVSIYLPKMTERIGKKEKSYKSKHKNLIENSDIRGSSLLSLNEINSDQENPSSEQKKQSSNRFCREILKRLRNIQVWILDGALDLQELKSINGSLKTYTQYFCDDPKTNELIEEIILKTEIEIAKLLVQRVEGKH